MIVACGLIHSPPLSIVMKATRGYHIAPSFLKSHLFARGSHVSPAEAFATRIKIFVQVKGQIAAARSWSFDFCNLEVALIP